MWYAKDITVRYGNKFVLCDVNFAANPGEITAIIGPNGSGKSTLLKALTDEVNYEGTVTLEGKDINHYSPTELATRRAVLMQSVTLSFPFRVWEVVNIGLVSGISGQHKKLIARALERVDLSESANSLYQELSGGQQRRVQFARVLVQVWEPRLSGKSNWLILDEPVANLDIAHQVAIMNIARQYAATGGGVIVVMHELNMAVHYAQSTCLMHEGKVIYQGPTQEVMQADVLSHIYSCPLLAIKSGDHHGSVFIPGPNVCAC